MIAVDVEADRKPAVRIDDELGRRLPAPASPAPGFLDQVVAEQALGDVGDGWRGKAGDHRQFGASDRSVHANGVQGDALIVIAGTFEVGPRQPHVFALPIAHRDAAVTADGCVLAWISASAASASAPSGPAMVPSPGGTMN